MTTTKWLTAAAIATAMIATPAMAQDRMSGDMTRAEMKAQARQDRAAQRGEARSQRMTQRDRSDMSDRRASNQGYAANDGWNNDGYWRSNNTGFFPGDVVGGVVGGAVGIAGAAVNTAGAIATAPFGGYNSNAYYGDSFASYDNGWDRGWNNSWSGNDSMAYRDDGFSRNRVQARANRPGATPLNNGSNALTASSSYAERNGFVCTPGTVFTAQNGRQTLCQ